MTMGDTLSTIEGQEVGPEHFRRVMGNVATAVSILTAHTAEGPVGVAVNSMTSVSLAPPMILVCPAKTSTTWPAIRDAGRFCVNVLAIGQEQICRRFATRGADRWAGVEWTDRSTGPALADAAAWIECVIRDEHDAGDHTIVVAEVIRLQAATEVDPLLYFQGNYGRLQA